MELMPVHIGVEDIDVPRIHRVFCFLEPIVIRLGVATEQMMSVDKNLIGAVLQILEQVVTRQGRLLCRRADVCEDDPVTLFNRMPRLPVAMEIGSAFRLARHFETLPLSIEEPAMIAAANALFLDARIKQRGAAMDAARIDQAGMAALVAKQNEFLAQQLHLERKILYFV